MIGIVADPADQYAALPWLMVGDQPRYLLVTSRRTGRWIFPKGSPERDETPAATALREAAEEAGVRGRPADRPLGRYGALKVTGVVAQPLVVELWPVEIRDLVASYPEAGLRQRRLVGLDEAQALVGQPDMARLIARLDARLAP